MVIGTRQFVSAHGRRVGLSLLVSLGLLLPGCARPAGPAQSAAPDPELARRGDLEVTAKLVEIPEGAIFKRELYDYATVLKYEVLNVHRGKLDGTTLYVGHYNPFKPRGEAADKRVPDVGGRLKAFRAGQVHRMALDGLIDDRFMGGIVNKYFDQGPGPIHWAVWTDLVSE